MDIDAFISIFSALHQTQRRVMKHSNHINIFSLHCSLSCEEIVSYASEAILAVLMVCIIHIDGPNRIGIRGPPTWCHFSSPRYTSRVLVVVKNSYPFQLAHTVEKLLSHRICNFSCIHIVCTLKPKISLEVATNSQLFLYDNKSVTSWRAIVFLNSQKKKKTYSYSVSDI